MAVQPEPRGRASGALWWVVGIIGLIAVLVVIGFAISPPFDKPGRQASPALQSTQVADVVNNTTQYLGKQVLVRGQIGDIVAPEAFDLASQGTSQGAAGNQSIQVVGKPDVLGSGLKTGDLEQVTGIIGIFVRTEIERQTGVSLDAKKYAPYEGKPVIIAQSVTKG